jgi:Uma2 family endonuclease
MAEAAKRLCSVEEFLAFAGEGDTRYQLVRGVVTAMAPAQAVHGEMVMRLGARMMAALPRGCRVISEAGIKPPQRDDTYWQVDIAVTCRPREPGEIYLSDPVLVVEVLSPSTQATDRVFKLPDYRSMASVNHILLVSTEAVRIEHWRRAGDLWQVRDLGPGTVLEIAELGLRIALDELYADMLLDEGEGGSADAE